MKLNLPVYRLGALALSAGLAAGLLGARCEKQLIVLPQNGDRVYAQGSGDDGLQGVDTTQKLKDTGKTFAAEYGFKNFNGDRLTARFEVAKDLYAGYEAAWGYKESDLAELKAWRDGARKQALADAVKRQRTQQQLNDAVALISKQYDQKRRDYLAARGFRLLDDGEVEVDMPALVREHAPRVASLAKGFDDIAAARRYGGNDTVDAMIAMVQTAVRYKVPPNVVDGVHTGGLWPPEETLVKGWGDCDTKTGLLASLLRNWPTNRVIGLSLPDHYVMGLQRIPQKGDHFVEYQGDQWVLVEPAGPAWLPPGVLSENTQRLLDGDASYKVDVLF